MLYQPATEYGSALQQVQELRTRLSARAWESAPAPVTPLRRPPRLTSNKLRRRESLRKSFGATSHQSPAQVSCVCLEQHV